MAVQIPAKFGKGTSAVLPHCAAIQFDKQICAWRRMSAGPWGRRAASRGMYSSNFLPLANISSPNSFKLSDALWSTPKQVPTNRRVRSHCPRAIEKFCGMVMPSGAERISASAKEGAPMPETTMAYWSAWPRRNFLTVDMCWPRTKG